MAENLQANVETYNQTMFKFGAPATVIHRYDHWFLLLRPAQVTLGALVLAARDTVTTFSALGKNAFTELAEITRDIETLLRDRFNPDKLNYLMLMMVDPDVHFHVLPRYADMRRYQDREFFDFGWPGPPELAKTNDVDAALLETLTADLSTHWT